MDNEIGVGIFASIRRRVRKEIAELIRDNPTLKRNRYPLHRRIFRRLFVDATLFQLLAIYCVPLGAICVSEWLTYQFRPAVLPGYTDGRLREFLTDIGSFLIAAQIGVLAIVTVAIGVVTILSERTDASSVNTNIRLYYVESRSYELAVSGTALLIVLVLQLFWPIQYVMHVFRVGGNDYTFKLLLCALHSSWFVVNLILFLQFILTTLRFVEPNSRSLLREKYVANVVIPHDLEARLLRSFYLQAPQQLFGEKIYNVGPRVTFGFGLTKKEAKIELERTFASTRVLRDVRLKPLVWVLKRWIARVQITEKPVKGSMGSYWTSAVAATPDFHREAYGRTTIVLRKGGTPFYRWERWILRFCFPFGRKRSQAVALPSPEDFLAQLIGALIRQTEKSANVGFDSALDEVTDFHRFVLAAQNTRDTAGQYINLAEIGGNFVSPEFELVRQYHRAYTAAVELIASDTYFIDRLSNLTWRLLPSDLINFSPKVIQSIMRLGEIEVNELEAWLSKRGGASSQKLSMSLSGSDSKSYDNAITGFIAGWERLELNLQIGAQVVDEEPPEVHWKATRRAFELLSTHLRIAATFISTAVWNSDDIATPRYVDLALRWLHPFYSELNAQYVFRTPQFILPTILTEEWESVQRQLTAGLQFQPEQVTPSSTFGIILREFHNDVICATGLVALHWYATGIVPPEVSGEAALQLLKKLRLASEGSDLTEHSGAPTPLFERLINFAFRSFVEPDRANGTYSTEISSIIKSITDAARSRIIPGRIYGGVVIEGFDEIINAYLAALVANVPDQGDGGFATVATRLKSDQRLKKYRNLSNFLHSIDQLIHALSISSGTPEFQAAVKLFKPNGAAPDAITKITDLFKSLKSQLSDLHRQRLLTAPIDDDRMNEVRKTVTKVLRERGLGLPCFENVALNEEPLDGRKLQKFQWKAMDRGLFTVPQLSGATWSDVPGLFVNCIRPYLQNLVWLSLYDRPKRIVEMDVSSGTDAFWKRAVAEARQFSSGAFILVPLEPLGTQISQAAQTYGAMDMPGFQVKYDPNFKGGDGVGYMGSIENVPVFTMQQLREAQLVLVCPRDFLRSITYCQLNNRKHLIDFELRGDEPERSEVEVSYVQYIEWSFGTFTEFRLKGL